MYIDNDLTLQNPAITTTSASPGTSYMSASIDLSQIRDVAEGHQLKLVTTMTGGFTNADLFSGVRAVLSTADTPTVAGAYSAPTNETALLDLLNPSGTSLAGATVAGLKVQTVLPLPHPVTGGLATPGSKHQRYMFVRYYAISASATAFTGSNAGNLQTNIVLDAQDGVTFYPNAYDTLPNPV
jgi:hypothetical protein